MSTNSSPSGLIDRAKQYPNLGALIFGGLGGAILAFFEEIIQFIQAIFGFVVDPLVVFTGQLGNIIIAFVGGAARIIFQGSATTISSIAPGGSFALGPFTFAEAIGAAALGLMVMAAVLALSPTSNLIPFSFTDYFGIGVDEGEEDFPEED